MKRKSVKKTRVSFNKSRITFVIFLALWLLVLDSLILNTLKENEMFIDTDPISGNVITGSTVRSVAPPTVEKAMPHLVLFNVVVAFLFTMSYIMWENKKRKLIKKR